MNNTLKNHYNFQPGTNVTGKWHQNRYTLIKKLGTGANGIVYLAEHNGGHVALKMSDSTVSVTSEVNVLKAFAKVQGSSLGPSLLDIDDWVTLQEKIPFYVMEYINGPDLLSFIKHKGFSWTGVLMVQLLSDLHRLHQAGWVFGDLKPENLIVSGPPTKIRCIDVGGTTIQGRAIKEFTEFFDRGYWGLGSRKAEPTYDLFATAMIMINLAYPQRFSKNGESGLVQLQSAIKKKPELAKFEHILLKALNGNYVTAIEMRDDLVVILTKQQKSFRQRKVNRATHTSTKNVQVRSSRHKQRKLKRTFIFLETLMIIAIVSTLYFIYVYTQL